MNQFTRYSISSSTILVIIGDADIVRPEHAIEMFRLFPHSELAVLPGTDHELIMQRSELLLPMILTFLDKSLPTS